MSWRETIVAKIGPGALCGITLGDWLRLLADNRFAVDPAFWLRAGAITWGAVQNSIFRRFEYWRYAEAIRATDPLPPVFILGIWRSGTTHLHNLLARDSRLATPSYYEALYPHTFLTTAWCNAPLLDRIIPRRRPMDNVAIGMGEPHEDEFALNCLTQMSFFLSWVFPRRAAYYDRFLTLSDCSGEEIARWQNALRWFVRKLTYKHGRRLLILKSPPHTGRIRLLLDVFPEARFVHIHRHPYNVFRSTCHLVKTAASWWALQRPDFAGLEERTLRQYEEVYAAFFAERGLIPAGRLHEIRFESLEADPLGQLRQMYDALQLGNFTVAEPAVRNYLDSIAAYEKNRFQELQPPWKEEVARRWRRCFEEWGYAV